jgi:hypothetical protein
MRVSYAEKIALHVFATGRVTRAIKPAWYLLIGNSTIQIISTAVFVPLLRLKASSLPCDFISIPRLRNKGTATIRRSDYHPHRRCVTGL